MACQVVYKDNKIQSVKDKQGDESKLFRSLASFPYINTPEEALELYKQAFAKDLVEQDLVYLTEDGQIFIDLQEALQSNQPLQVGGISEEGNFEKLYDIPVQYDIETKEGFIASNIRDGLLSPTKQLYKGGSYFVAEGVNYAEKKLNLDALKKEGRVFLEGHTLSVNEGMISINEIEPLNKEEFHTEQEINAINNLKKELLDTTKATSVNKTKPVNVNRDELRLKLLNILSQLGVDTISISDYVRKYSQKNGVEPTAEALADISNRVIAIKEGRDTLENLTEETLHFIVEALPQEQIENVLRNINSTKEYSQFQDTYRKIYSKEYPADQVENLVRREVLAKVMKSALLNETDISENRKGFLKNAYDFIISFFNKINPLANTKSELSNINKILEDLFINDNLDTLNTRNLDSNRFVLYSITSEPSGDIELDKMRAIMKSTLGQLKLGLNSISRNNGSLSVDAKAIKDYELVIDNVGVGSTTLDFVGYVNRQASYVQNAINKAQANNTGLSLEELNILNNLRGSLRQLLQSQVGLMRDMEPSKLGFTNSKTAVQEKNTLIAKVEEVNKKIGNLAGRADNLTTNAFSQIVDRVIEQSEGTLPENYRKFVEDSAKEMQRDTGFFMSTFGQIMHASDPILNLTSNIISELRFKQNVNTQKAYRKFAARLEELGIGAEELATLADNGFIIDQYNHREVKTAREKAEYDAYIFATEETIDQDTYKERKKDGKLVQFTPEQAQAYIDKKNELEDSFKEKPMNADYYKAQKEKYEKLGISNSSITWLKSLSVQRSTLQNDARQEDGTIVYNEFQKETLKSISQTRKAAKSFYTPLGTLKDGIRRQLPNDNLVTNLEASGTRYLEKGGLIYTLKENPSNKALLSFDLSLIDESFKQELREKNNSLDDFIIKFNEIVKANGLAEGVEFVRNNLGISLSSEFWDQTARESVLDSEYLNSIEENKENIERIKDLSNRRNEIKKLYTDSQNPSEVEGNEIEKTVKDEIKSLTDQIEFLKSDLKGIDDVPSLNIEIDAQREPNRAYFRELKSLGIEELSQEELRLIKDNLSTRSATSLDITLLAADKLDNNEDASDTQISRLEQYRNEGETYRQAAIRYGRTRLLPYYQRFTPTGYQTLDDIISDQASEQQNIENIISYINDKNNDPNYEMNVHYTFQQTEQDGSTNPLFNPNYEGGYFQPKLDKFRNDKYFELFKPNSQGQPTDNINLFEAREALLDLQRENLKDIGENGSHNLFLLPQISRSSIEKASDFMKKENKGKTLKESLKDTFTFRIDDKEYGEEQNGINIKQATDANVIPKFYLRELEEETDVSTDLFYSYLMFTKQAKLYKARVEGFSDIMALEDKMLNRNYASGKVAQTTSNYKMFKSHVDYNFYGNREVTQYKVELPLLGEVDFTKFFRVVADYVRNRNLGYNFIVPFTSLITAESQVQIEATLGEYISRDSLRLASREFRKNLFKEAANKDNALGYNDKSKVNVLGEWLNIYEMSDKAKDAKYSTMTRHLPKLAFLLHQAGNFPVIPRVFLSALYDNRVVDGRILTKQQFIKARQNDGTTTKAQYLAEWTSLENMALYNLLDVKPTGVEYKQELLTELNGDIEYLDNKVNQLRKNISQTIQFVDTQIPEGQRTTAQRNALFSFITMHRSFLSIGLTRRFKDRQVNLESGQLEEGSYMTLKNTLVDAFGYVGTGENKSYNFIKNLVKAYNEPIEKGLGTTLEQAELRKRNLKRVGVEFGVMSAIVLLATIVKAMADDPDNEDIYGLQLSNYLLFRMANETASSQFAITSEVGSLIKSPVIGYSQLVDAVKLANLFDGDEITRGNYKGLTQRQKYLLKTIPGVNSWYDMLNPRTKQKTYEFYNEDNLNTSSLYLYSLMNE